MATEKPQRTGFVFRDSYLVSAILLGDTTLSSATKSIVEKRHGCADCLQRAPDVRTTLDIATSL